jgi:nicotinate phosphoribosyltransferase
MVSVAKKSLDKASVGGRKYALRRRSAQGVAEAEVLGVGAAPATDSDDRSLLEPLIRDGDVVGREPLSAARQRHRAARDELPPPALQMSRGEPAIPTIYEEATDR